MTLYKQLERTKAEIRVFLKRNTREDVIKSFESLLVKIEQSQIKLLGDDKNDN